MAEEIKTMAISAMLEETEATGLITEGAQEEAIKAKRMLAEEQIRNLKRLYYMEGSISLEYMESELSRIQQETQDDITALESDPDMDILS